MYISLFKKRVYEIKYIKIYYYVLGLKKSHLIKIVGVDVMKFRRVDETLSI